MVQDIVMINDYACINGGLTKIAIDGAIGLARLGKRVTYVAISGEPEQRMHDAGVDVRCMNQPDIWEESNRAKSMLRGVWNKPAMDFVRSHLGEFDPAKTILHCQGYSRALSPAIGKLMRDSGFAHVYSAHDYMLACPNGTFFHHQEQAICRRQPLGMACLTTNCDMRSALHKPWRVARQVAANRLAGLPGDLPDIIYTSELHRRTIAPFLNPATRLHYVPNPISIAKQDRVRAEDNDIYLFISRFAPEKGAPLFAQAAKDAGVKAVFVGDGPERARIEAINPDAHITGWVSPGEVEAWLSRARCLVFPSIWSDASPLTVREALAKGVPVICGEWNAGSEAIEHGKTGFVASDSSPSTWQALIREAERKAEELSCNAYRAYWSDPVDEVRHGELLLAVYEKATSAQRIAN